MMSRFEIIIKPFGKSAILIEWPKRIEDSILDDIIQFTSIVLANEESDLINHTPGYNSLLLQYNAEVDFDLKKQLLQALYKGKSDESITTHKSWHIPVCYDNEFGLDISLFADRGLSSDDVIQLHTSKPFRVFMIGFLPGFLYLGGLPEDLHMHRKEKPRLQVPKGTVAIGGEQTGIYPMTSPGGWQLIGRTPLALFDLSDTNPTPIQQGDYIQFYSIDKKTYQILSSHSEKTIATKA